MTTFLRGLLGGVLLLVASPAFAGHAAIQGRVLDRNGQPVERAVVTLIPGNVQLVTDADGKFLIDYLRDDAGARVKLAHKVNYRLEVFKPGFTTAEVKLYYKAGLLAMDDMTLKEDTITVTDDASNLDPGLFSDRTQSSGATYEGQ